MSLGENLKGHLLKTKTKTKKKQNKTKQKKKKKQKNKKQKKKKREEKEKKMKRVGVTLVKTRKGAEVGFWSTRESATENKMLRSESW